MPKLLLADVIALALAAFLLVLALPVRAHAPGEDPVILKNKLSIPMQPTAPAPKSSNLDGNTSMPAWMRARISRYEAKAFSGDTTGIYTDNDVVQSANAEGMKKTCVQEVGSNTGANSGAGRYGPGQAPQIVVLRGDLVNICN